MPDKRFSVTFKEQLWEEARAVASKKGVSLADVVRMSMSLFIEMERSAIVSKEVYRRECSSC